MQLSFHLRIQKNKYIPPAYFCSLTNATKKLIDSSARNPLIYLGLTSMPSGLRPALGREGRRENVQTESKPCRLPAEMVLSAVRKNPQEPAQTRGSRQKKANRLGLAFKVLVVECGRGFKADLQSLEATLRHLSAFLEIVRFTSWQSSDWR
jgi:hypothetical protein